MKKLLDVKRTPYDICSLGSAHSGSCSGGGSGGCGGGGTGCSSGCTGGGGCGASVK